MIIREQYRKYPPQSQDRYYSNCATPQIQSYKRQSGSPIQRRQIHNLFNNHQRPSIDRKINIPITINSSLLKSITNNKQLTNDIVTENLNINLNLRIVNDQQCNPQAIAVQLYPNQKIGDIKIQNIQNSSYLQNQSSHSSPSKNDQNYKKLIQQDKYIFCTICRQTYSALNHSAHIMSHKPKHFIQNYQSQFVKNNNSSQINKKDEISTLGLETPTKQKKKENIDQQDHKQAKTIDIQVSQLLNFQKRKISKIQRNRTIQLKQTQKNLKKNVKDKNYRSIQNLCKQESKSRIGDTKQRKNISQYKKNKYNQVSGFNKQKERYSIGNRSNICRQQSKSNFLNLFSPQKLDLKKDDYQQLNLCSKQQNYQRQELTYKSRKQLNAQAKHNEQIKSLIQKHKQFFNLSAYDNNVTHNQKYFQKEQVSFTYPKPAEIAQQSPIVYQNSHCLQCENQHNYNRFQHSQRNNAKQYNLKTQRIYAQERI